MHVSLPAGMHFGGHDLGRAVPATTMQSMNLDRKIHSQGNLSIDIVSLDLDLPHLTTKEIYSLPKDQRPARSHRQPRVRQRGESHGVRARES